MQQWLGLAFCIIWIFGIKFILYYGKKKNEEVDNKLKSAGDCAIRVSNLPYGEYSEEELIDYIYKIYEKAQNDRNS